MDSLSHLFNEFVAPSYEPTAEDWADYSEYLDSVGYDNGDDDWDEDPDEDRGFQPFDASTRWPFEESPF